MGKKLELVEPMECKPVKDLAQLPRGSDWQYELKFDGYRCIAIKDGKEVKLFSARGDLRSFRILSPRLDCKSPGA